MKVRNEIYVENVTYTLNYSLSPMDHVTNQDLT